MSFHLTKSIDMNGQQIIDHGSPLQNTQAHHYDSYGLTEANTRNIKEPADSKFHQDKNEKNLKLSSDLKQSVSSEPLLNSNNIHAGESTKDLSAKFSLRYGPTSFGWLPDSSKDKKSTDSLGLKTHSYLLDEKQLHHNLSLDFQHENVDPDRQYHDIGLLFGVFPISIHWYDWFYPPSTPRECQLLRWENLAVPLCYLTVGLLQGLSGPFVNVYPLDLGATQAQQVTLSCLRVLPASFKILFGFWSDTLPLYGYRRKSYMAVGWAVCSMSMWALVMLSDLKIYPDYETDEGTKTTTFVVGNEAPSIPFLSACLLGFGTGLWFADVMADSVVAEKAKLEPEDSRGHLLSTCYACRFFGLMVAAPLSAITYSLHGPRVIVILMALLPISILPSVYYLWEIRYVPIKPMVAQCNEIWDTVCSRAVWQPMGFVYLYNILQVGNAAWREYLFSVLGFTANQLNTLLIMAYVLLYLGILTYKYYLIHWSWRSIYITTTLLNGFFSALQLLLIYGITFGMDPFWFALGDDVFADFISGIQFLVSKHCDAFCALPI